MSHGDKYVLDTSILFENISQDNGTVLKKLSDNGITRRYHLNHCLIEFRLGLLQNWIGFYLDVLATQDIPGAKRRLGKRINFQPRQGSNYMLLDGLLSEICGRLEAGTPALFLPQIEECISYAQTSLKLLSGKIVGSNDDHHILRPEFIAVDDYEEFHRRCKEDYVVDLSEIFATKRSRFVELVDYLKSLPLKGKEKKLAESMIKLIEQGLADVSKVNLKTQNRRYGDIVIAMDTTSNYRILSSDNSFKLLCGGLKKNFLDYKDL